MPVMSSVAFLVECDSLPCIRVAARRSSSSAVRKLSWISLSVAARIAIAVRERGAISSS